MRTSELADREAGEAWMAEHPAVPGQLITQPEAEDLGTRLFGHLLASDDGPCVSGLLRGPASLTNPAVESH